MSCHGLYTECSFYPAAGCLQSGNPPFSPPLFFPRCGACNPIFYLFIFKISLSCIIPSANPIYTAVCRSKERQEATRKSVEARGISDFQKIVSEGISPALLQWKGIEATENLAKSQNSKIVMVGNTAGSLPVILGGDAATANAPATQH